MEVPQFEAYLRERLLLEHRVLRIERSRSTWRTTALVAVAAWVVSVVALVGSPRGGTTRVPVLGHAPQGRLAMSSPPEGSLEKALAASLAQDRALARRLAGNAVPDKALVVSRFPLVGGGSVSIYTQIAPWGGATNATHGSHGGEWE